MSRPKSHRRRTKARRPPSPAQEARLQAMRDELWSRCVEMQAIHDARMYQSPLPTAYGDGEGTAGSDHSTPIMLATSG